MPKRRRRVKKQQAVHQRYCRWCERKFETKRCHAQFCSNACRQANHHSQQKDLWGAL